MTMKPYYQDASCTIYHGDCRDCIACIPPVDVIVTDPPYGIEFATNHKRSGIGASWHGTVIAGDDETALRDQVLSWWDGRPALVFGSWKAPKPEGVRTVLIWDKGPASGMGDLSIPWKASWEEIYVIGRGFAGHRGEGVLKGFTIVGWETRGRTHPNEKPVSLMRELIGKCPGGTILDPFMGSGSTLRAAKDMGRCAVGIEIEERYCEIAAKRLRQSVMALEVAS
jgi:DNA modification methylase